MLVAICCAVHVCGHVLCMCVCVCVFGHRLVALSVSECVCVGVPSHLVLTGLKIISRLCVGALKCVVRMRGILINDQ